MQPRSPTSSTPGYKSLRGLRLGLAVAALAVDLVLATRVTGLLATAAMLLVAVDLTVLSFRGAATTLLGRVVSLPRARAALLLVMLGFTVARGYLVFRRLVPGDGSEAQRIAAARTYLLVFVVAALLLFALHRFAARARLLMSRLAERPAALLAASFGLLIGAVTLLLTLPISVVHVSDISLLDSLFTATSAVCVTGLAVNDVGATYTPFGEVVILGAIQAGGVGMMTLAALALRGGDSLAEQARYQTMLESRSLADLRSLARSVAGYTLAIEAAGALCLAIAWWDDPRLGERSLAWVAIFHAVSAFCNAGFSLFPDSMIAFRGDAGVQLVLVTLILLGGIGFPVLRELGRRLEARGRELYTGQPAPRQRLSLQLRVAVTTSLWLLGGGFVAFLLLESTALLSTVSLGDGLLAAIFTSVNTRSAGFNSVDLAQLQSGTLLVIIPLMLIGGSPGSTAGGIKTTTVAVIFAAMRGELRGRDPELGGRSIPATAVRRAIAVVALSSCLLLPAILLLTITERGAPFLAVLFEACAAFGTAGMSLGLTPALSVAGKLVIITTMFVGRVGPLTIALAVGEGRKRQLHRLAPEDLPVG